MTSHYDVLGVHHEATPGEIKQAYYRRARAFHPDAHAGSTNPVLAEAQRAMSELNEAWNVLRDDQLRVKYDRHLAAVAERERPSTTPGRRRRPAARRDAKPIPQLSVANGFRYWMSSCGSRSTPERGTRIHLSVEGATDFSPLRDLAPNGLWGLHADRSAMDDAALVHLGGMHGLQLLDISSTSVGDAGLVHLQGLENLETLSLWDTAITDAGLRLIARIPSLCLLGLGRTRVTDAGLAHLAGLEHLRILQLWGTDVTGPGLAHLHRLPNLERVTLPRRVRGRHRRRLRRARPGISID